MDDAGPPIATPSVCWWNAPLKIKNVVRSRNSSSSNIWSGNRFVRSWRVVSLFSRSLMTRRASLIGMLVYRDSTSKDTMISSGSMVCCRMNCEKSLEFLQCCWLSLVLWSQYACYVSGQLVEW